MRILLIQPNYDVHVIHPPLGLGYLASYLRIKGHQVFIFDATLKNASFDETSLAIRNFKPDLIGITVLSRGHNKAENLIKFIRQVFPKIKIVVGGTQVTAFPKEVLSDLKADFAVVGEGEITLHELVEAIKERKTLSNIKGLAYFQDNKFKINSARELIKNLDDMPFPAWDLMPPSEYKLAPILEPARAFPIAPILTSRGCPYNCSFCASNVTWKRRLRFRSVENVLVEIKLLKEKYKVKEIHFCDDNFTADVTRAEEICEAMVREKINLPWQCPNGVRIDRLPLSLLQKMKASGCYAVGLGIESGNYDMLRKINKQLDLKIVSGVLKNLRTVGIESYGFFILGLPGETKKTANQTIDFALKNDFDRLWFNIFLPYPGSSSFGQWLGKRKFSDIDWEKHDGSTAVMRGADLSLKEIENLQKLALRKFYTRPKIFFKLVSRIGVKEISSLMLSRFFRKSLRLKV